GLDHPYWVDDDRFDLEFHVRELALPTPGTDAQLAEQVARIFARQLDRSRPLWELYVIQGLKGSRVAVFTKIHHSAVDGLSGAEILSVLLDGSPEGREIEPAPSSNRRGERKPSDWEMLGRGLAALPMQPLHVARRLPKTLANLDVLPTMRHLPGAGLIAGSTRRIGRVLSPRRDDGGVLEGRRLRAPRTRFQGSISPYRRIAFGSIPLSEAKAIKNAAGCTVNDVVMATCAGAMRSFLVAHKELPAEPLVTMVPVSVRTPEQFGTFGNRVSTMIVELPTDERDPAERLQRVHETMRSAKERHQALPASLLQDANEVIPPALLARASRVTARLAVTRGLEAPTNLVISNVPGSPTPMFLAGARLEAQFPVSAIIDGVGINITVLSYRDQLDFGIVADREMLDDAWDLIKRLKIAHAELLALVPRSSSSARRNGARAARA
ncbi:MAG TPA: wax ester/triacylglycerol synthase family O-acyltransferase, partial [Solirubrobacteraceae bacterium]|nr:wax ester/triacylglycerol synthase family O-acyltransferase [Solirubrobacteraceae bacterium]